MKRNISIRLKVKAAFLLIIFFLNTIIGFACAVGIDMGFNTTNHNDEEGNEACVHIHNNGEKHIHGNGDSQHHQNTDKAHHESKDQNDNCCHDKVTKFEQLAKLVPGSISIIQPAIFTAIVYPFYKISGLSHADSANKIRQIVRSYHPPIKSIRIAIQSFQI